MKGDGCGVSGGDAMRLRTWLVALTAGAALAVAMPAAAQLPALRDRPLSAAERTRLTALESQLARVSQQRSLSVNAVRAIAQALGERLTTQDPDQLIRAIDERAQELGAARGRISALERDLEALDSMRLAQAVGPLLTAANASIEAGQLSDAEAKLAEAAERFASARQGLQGRVDDLSVREADILSQQAAVRASRFDYASAATLYGRAAALAPAAQPAVRWGYLIKQGEALRDHARWAGDMDSLRQAAAIYRDAALPLVPQATHPVDWAATQERLGVALAEVSWRAEDPAGVRQAIDALRLAAEGTERATHPREWAKRRVELATRMGQAAERAVGLGDLPQAVAMLRAVEPHGNLPDGFHRNYGAMVALMGLRQGQLGQTAEGAATLRQAVEILRRGATPNVRTADPREYAMTQQNLAFALKLISDATTPKDPAIMRQSIAAAEEGLAAIQREQAPLLWANLQRRIGYGRMELSQMSTPVDRALLDAGVAQLRTALEVMTRERSPSDWAAFQGDLATALRIRGMLETTSEALEPALVARRATDDVFTRQARPRAWAQSHGDQGLILAEQARRSQGAVRSERVAQARAAFAEARDTFQQIGDAASVARVDAALAALDAPPS